MMFDSWGGQLPPKQWDRWSRPYIERIVQTVSGRRLEGGLGRGGGRGKGQWNAKQAVGCWCALEAHGAQASWRLVLAGSHHSSLCHICPRTPLAACRSRPRTPTRR